MKINKLAFLAILFVISSCAKTDVKFNKQLWNKNFDGFYEHRENMVNDLLKSHLKKGMTYEELTDLIGEPQNYENLKNNTITYSIMEDYGWDIDPVESKTLNIKLSEDSLVENFEVKHWKR